MVSIPLLLAGVRTDMRDGEAGANQCAASGTRFDRKNASQPPHALIHPQQSEPSRGGVVETTAVVPYRDYHFVVAVLHGNANGAGLRMSRGIVQRLLDDTVD